MRALMLLLVGVACTTEPPPPPPAPTSAQVAAQFRVPAEKGPGQISGSVTKSDGAALMLDSGGAQPVPLRIADDARVTIDGKPGRATDVHEGDMVRAAFSRDASGDPTALQIVVNSRPPATPPVQAGSAPTRWTPRPATK